MSSLLQTLRQWIPFALYGAVSDAVATKANIHAPLFNEQALLDLASALEEMSNSVMPNPVVSHALRQGEQASPYLGSGLEYEESRPYEMGDEIRHINWRLMAKTGKAYTKRFQEERQENWFIVVDHRASMRFGTRVRLKATQASQVAGYFAWMAEKQGVPVSGARITEHLEQTPIYEGKNSFMQLMQLFAKACPPINQATTTEVHLNDILLSIAHQLPNGSRCIIISDFHDITTRTTEILAQMQLTAMIKAVWIQDPAELSLPAMEGVQLQSLDGLTQLNIDSSVQRNAFNAGAEVHLNKIKTALLQAGIHPVIMQSDEPISAFHCFKVDATITPEVSS